MLSAPFRYFFPEVAVLDRPAALRSMIPRLEHSLFKIRSANPNRALGAASLAAHGALTAFALATANLTERSARLARSPRARFPLLPPPPRTLPSARRGSVAAHRDPSRFCPRHGKSYRALGAARSQPIGPSRFCPPPPRTLPSARRSSLAAHGAAPLRMACRLLLLGQRVRKWKPY